MMRFAALLMMIVTFMGLLVGCKRPPDAATNDKSRLQGDWVVEKVEGMPEGEAAKVDDMKKGVLTVKDNLATMSVEGNAQWHATFKLDPSKSPKWVDLFEANEQGESISKVKGGGGDTKDPPPEGFRAIYQIDDKQLTIAIGSPGTPRPTEFKPAPAEKAAGEKAVAPADKGGVVVMYLKKK